MKWTKLGLIIEPNHGVDWMRTHAMIPVADRLDGDIYRIYFSGRNRTNQSLIGFVEINITDPSRILRVSSRPALGLGELGCFDDNGVTPSWIVHYGNEIYLYYIGWNPRSSVRMKLFGGLAISGDGGETFKRHSRVPIIDRSDAEPFLNTAPCVLRENEKWRMWYVSGVEWVNPDLPRYNIKYAESQDGKTWTRNGHVCIDFLPGENALARPCVLFENGIYRMWYSYKSHQYRVGYAESVDGWSWRRMDERAGIDVSSHGWDSDMIEYSYVFRHGDRYYMLYNGNDYGAGGAGLAVTDGLD